MPSDERILSPDQVAEIRATHRCRKCMGTGRVEHGCSLCGDSTYDHDCNDWSETCGKCSGFGGDADIDALLASHAALAERVAALEDAERIAWALARGSGAFLTADHLPVPHILRPHPNTYWTICFLVEDPPKSFRRVMHTLGNGPLPVLTPDARAAIDAARKESERG